jgi:hypothetical protein
MATTHATPVTEQPVPNPRLYPLRALKTVLGFYLRLGGPVWLPDLEDFHPLAAVSLFIEYFLSESYVSTVLCCLIPAFLLMIDRQLKRKQRVYGGKYYRNSFSEADLDQQPVKRDALRLMTSDALFRLLKDELRLLVRLLRAAQEAYRLYDSAWEERHKAASIVLLRLSMICAQLRKRGSRFFAEECLRYQAQAVWNELYARAKAPEPVAKWLRPMEAIKPWGKYHMARHLVQEQAAGHPIPAPFVERLPVWAEELSA